MKTPLLIATLCASLFAGDTNTVQLSSPYAWEAYNGTELFYCNLATNVVTEWLNLPSITNVVREMNGHQFQEVKQVGFLVTNRVLTVFHDDQTNEMVLRNLGRGEWPTERRTVYSQIPK